jgi:hypothetical protein
MSAPLVSVDIVSNKDMVEAVEISTQVEELLESIRHGAQTLATEYVRLGVCLYKIRVGKHWIPLGYRSFGGYMESVRNRIQLGRTQLYAYISTTEKLLPSIGESDLNKIGISKAKELTKYVRETGGRVPDDLVQMALDRSVGQDELRGAVFEALHSEALETGKYFDMGGCYLTADEMLEVKGAFELACRVDPMIPIDQPEHMRKKEILLRLCREFVATYVDEVMI